MRCGFRPHDRDRTTYSMEESLVGFELFREEFLLHTQMDFADARLTVGVPNDLQMERNLTGGIPRPLDKTRSIPRTFNTRS